MLGVGGAGKRRRPCGEGGAVLHGHWPGGHLRCTEGNWLAPATGRTKSARETQNLSGLRGDTAATFPLVIDKCLRSLKAHLLCHHSNSRALRSVPNPLAHPHAHLLPGPLAVGRGHQDTALVWAHSDRAHVPHSPSPGLPQQQPHTTQ